MQPPNIYTPETPEEALMQYLDYIKEVRRYSAHTLKAYRRDLHDCWQFLHTTYACTHWTEVETLYLRAWIVDLMQKKRTPNSIHRKLSSVRALYTHGRKHWYWTKRPTQGLRAPKKPKRQPRFISQNDAKTLINTLEFADGFSGARDQLILALLYGTGMRNSELCQLSVQDIQFERQIIRIQGKGDKARAVPIIKALQRLLQNYLELRAAEFPRANSNTLILTDKGEPAYAKLIYRKVKHYVQQVSTEEKASPHLLRHSFATHLSQRGVDLESIRLLLGHDSLAATQIYTHYSLAQLQSAYQKLDDASTDIDND